MKGFVPEHIFSATYTRPSPAQQVNNFISIEKNLICYCSVKRYLKIDRQLARHFVYYVECLSSPPPFSSQIITPFLNSMISTNQGKGLEF